MSTSRVLKINFPGKLVFGNGVLKQLEEDLIHMQCRGIILMTIAPLMDQLAPFIQALRDHSIQVTVDTSIVQEPTFADFRKIMEQFHSADVDTVVGIGGGSVLDVAKLVAAQLGNTQTLEEIVGNGLLEGRGKRLICIPATSGTGSEVSPNAILVDDEGQKKGIISPFLVPDMVYADPLLTLSLPASITAATGLDALTHCLEAYTNKFSQPFIDMYAFEGMRLIASNLEEAVNNGGNEEARSQVALGSILGGFCLGPVNTAGVHALSYPLGSLFHLPHGLSNALLLPYVMEYNYSASPKKYAEVAIALGCNRGATDEETAHAGIAKIKELIKVCGIPARLRELDIPKDAIPQMAEDAMKITRLLVNNPREIKLSDAISIFNAAY
ncbi:iron-containing alcohol dehydrogenase [Sphingobacterium pedocola]|uniref:Alcohol dehydrogenase n=1 Tax=Sphingobacterium pedocola TaxID=2082722 RepID=A0ABR9T8C4_9SPHI|nr:iron-containing alcohol dehydrogenase [Sphingobacterium pedocola]MBE8721593.1 alcohol dehydrogenase [Sphingobacterium pedocola]